MADIMEDQAALQEHDPEDAWAGEELGLEETDEELDQPAKRPAAKEKALRLRGAIELDEQEYGGKTSSRKAIFGDDVLPASSNGFGDLDGSDDEDPSENGGSTDEDIRELRSRQEASAGPPDNGTDDGGLQPDFDGGGSEEDEEAAALEREVEAIRAQDDTAITDRVNRVARDRAKGAAVKNQKALWERMLEMRILLQRCLQAANRLAQPHMHPVACSINPGLRSGYRGLSDASTATLDQLLDLHDALLERTPAAQQSAADAGSKSASQKRKRDAHSDDSVAGQQWQRVDAAYQRFAPFRDSSMDRWHRKTMLMTGSGALRSNLKALNQSLSARITALSKDSGPAVLRARLPLALSNPFMGQPPREDVGEEDDDLEPAVEERDVETFDDSEFYQQLLKEFLEGSAVGSGAGALVASAGGAKKRRKNVERRASKGRKLRYQVMEKLVHFMTPVPRAETMIAPQLFSNLFNQPRTDTGAA